MWGIAVLAVGLVLLDAAGIASIPTWLFVATMPLVGALIWRLGGGSILAIGSWVIPLAAVLYVGFEVLSPPLAGLVIAAGYLWFVGMILWNDLVEAWYRLLRLG